MVIKQLGRYTYSTTGQLTVYQQQKNLDSRRSREQLTLRTVRTPRVQVCPEELMVAADLLEEAHMPGPAGLLRFLATPQRDNTWKEYRDRALNFSEGE